MSNQDWNKNVELWGILQKRIHELKIEMTLDIPQHSRPCPQELNGKNFIMDISSEISEELSTYLIATFSGRVRKKDIRDLSKLMGYLPFVSYKKLDGGILKTTVEWSLKATERFEDLYKTDDIQGISCLETQFTPYREEKVSRSRSNSTTHPKPNSVAEPSTYYNDMPIHIPLLF